MKLEYDINAGALYIRLSDAEIVRTAEAGDNAAVDLDAQGRVVGIEVLSVGYPWPVTEVLSSYGIPPQEEAEIRAYFCFQQSPVQPEPKMSTGSPAPAMAAG